MHRTIVLAAIPLAAALGCHHRVAPDPAPVNPCWSHVATSPLPPDSIARRYLQAFNAVGLSDAMWFSQADTAWTLTHLAPVRGASDSARSVARVVAYRRGDSTRVRQFVATAAGADGLPALCAGITRAAAVPMTVDAGPSADESLSVWRLGVEP